MCYMEQQMQQYMESGEVERDDLLERLEPPADWEQPVWTESLDTTDWKWDVPLAVQWEWLSLSGRQRLMLSAGFKMVAARLSNQK